MVRNPQKELQIGVQEGQKAQQAGLELGGGREGDGLVSANRPESESTTDQPDEVRAASAPYICAGKDPKSGSCKPYVRMSQIPYKGLNDHQYHAEVYSQ